MTLTQLVCVYPPYRGGIGRSAERNHNLFRQAGIDARVLVPRYDADFPEQEGIVRMPSWLRWGNAALLRGLAKQLRATDLVYLHYPFFGTSELLACLYLFSLAPKRLIIHYHMDTPRLGLLKGVLAAFAGLFLPVLVSRAEKVIVSSENYLENSRMAAYYRRDPQKFLVIPFAVETDIFVPRTENTRNETRLLFVGGMDEAHAFKGVDVLLRAFALAKNDNLKMYLVGDGALRPGYEKLASELGISDRLEFLGNIDDTALVRAYRDADIFVLPSTSRHEAFGIVLLEAMSSGLALIASNLPGVSSVFRSPDEGLLVEPGSVEDLAAKIRSLASDPERMKQMGRNARRHCVEAYSSEVVGEKLLNVLKPDSQDYKDFKDSKKHI